MSIFEQPDIRSNTKTGGMMRKINLTLTGVLAVLAFVFTLDAGPIHAQVRTFATPACPIKAHTVPSTKTQITLPDENPLGKTFSIEGIVEVTDQNGAAISFTSYDVTADSTHVVWARTVNQDAHFVGSLAFDKGCTANDQFGSNNCTWKWGQSVTAAYGGTLQEDVTDPGKFIVDLKVNSTTPNVQFMCPVCGAICTITIPQQLVSQNAQGQNNQGKIWDLMTFPLFLTTPLPFFRILLEGPEQ